MDGTTEFTVSDVDTLISELEAQLAGSKELRATLTGPSPTNDCTHDCTGNTCFSC